MKKVIVLISLFVSGLWSFAQAPKYPVLSIPVHRNGVQMRLPWSGGMDSPQFSYIDIDGDGMKDLFVFDRAGEKARVFINTGGIGDTAYRYAPEYEPLLPDGLNNWALMRDYNKDGVPDLFTHDPLGIMVYKGSRRNGVLHYDLVCPLLRFASGNFNPNMWTNIADVPVITDVNHDGDIDILAYTIFGTSVDYFENQSVEHPGDPYYDIDSFRYLSITGCWGGFTQNQFSNSIVLHDTLCIGEPVQPPGGGNTRHTGNSLYGIYPYGNDAVSLLNGNIGYLNLMFLRNCGTSQFADVCEWDSLYPLCSGQPHFPVIIPPFPAAYGADINNDGMEDLLVAPNGYGYPDFGLNVNNVWQYNNTGDTNCLYEYQGDTFMVEHMPDFGSDSKPVFYDMNGDSLQDMVIGNYGYYESVGKFKSTLSYYQNTGTRAQPKFSQVTDDYDSISKFNLTAVSPSFGDLDGDGKPDMLLGEQNGFVHFFKNSGTTGSVFTTMTTPEYFAIKVSNGFSAPFIYDVNGDSLNDIIIGCYDGTLSYYWNYGTKTSPLFSTDSSNQNFGGVNVTPYGFAQGLSQPFIMKDTTGQMILLVGNAGGTVYEYIINPDSLRTFNDTIPADSLHSMSVFLHSGSFVLVDSNFLHHNVGADAIISAADLNNDGHLEYVVGNEMGGLFMFADSLYDSSNVINSVQPLHLNELEIFPNPARDYFTCSTGNVPFIHPQTEVYNILGEIVPAEIRTGTDKVTVFTNGLSNGFYLVRISDENKSYTGKVLLQR